MSATEVYDMRAAVRRGIEKLDAERPGWRGRIDWGGLDMHSCLDCIIGQLFGDFDKIIHGGRLDGVTENNAADFGLNLPDKMLDDFNFDDDEEGKKAAYRELADTWRKEGH